MGRGSWKPRRGLRLVLRRSALAWWIVTLLVGGLTASVVSSSVSRATEGAEAWGSTRAVWVVTRALDAGEVIDPNAVRRARRPRGVVPEGALDGVSSPVGEATRVALAPGEVVLVARLAGRGAHGIAAMVRPGYRAVAVPNDDRMPAVRVGDRVDVLATFDVGDDLGGAAGTAAPSFPVARNAEVLAVTARALTLAVDADDAPRIAFALAKGAVAISLRGGTVSERARPR